MEEKNIMTRKEMLIIVNRVVMSKWTQAKEVWDSVPYNATITRIDYCQCGYLVWG